MPWDPLPGAAECEPAPLGDALERLVRHLGSVTVGDYQHIEAAWLELVGRTIAAHAWPSSLRDGQLMVTVDDPAWATEIRFLERQLLDRLEQLLPGRAPTRVELRVQPLRPDGRPLYRSHDKS